MDKLTCASCGAEMDSDATVCPNCGAEVQLEDNGVDNSDAIAAMLRSAAKMMQDTEIPAEAEISDETVEAEPVSPELSKEQQDKLDKGEIVDLSAMQPPKRERSAPVSLSEPEPQPAVSSVEEVTNEEETVAPSDEATDNAFLSAVVPSKTEEAEDDEKNDNDEKPAKAKKEKKTKAPKAKKTKTKEPKIQGHQHIEQKQRKGAPIKTIVTVVLLLAILGVGFYFGGKYLFSYKPSADQLFAQNCAKAVTSTFNSDSTITVVDAYINEKTTENVCLLYAVKSGTAGEGTLSWYRIKVNKSEPEKYNVYMPLSDEYYEMLKNDGTERDFILAAVLKSYDNEMQREITEIINGSNSWTKLDAGEVNYYYNDDKETAATTQAVEDTAETTVDEYADVEDLV